MLLFRCERSISTSSPSELFVRTLALELLQVLLEVLHHRPQADDVLLTNLCLLPRPAPQEAVVGVESLVALVSDPHVDDRKVVARHTPLAVCGHLAR